MEVWLRVDLNAFSIIAAIIMIVSLKSREERSFLDYRLFMLMLAGVIFELFVDALMWSLEGNTATVAKNSLLVLAFLYYAFHPFTPMCYLLFVANRITGNSRLVRSRMPWAFLVFALCFVLCLASVWTGWFFYVDASGIYHRGPLFALSYSFSYIFMFGALGISLLRAFRHPEADRKVIRSFILFPIFPSIAGILQILFYGIVLVWPAMTLALMAVYVNIQQSKLSIDYLTGAFNRRRLDEFLGDQCREITEARSQPSPARSLGAFLADIDNFKSINDTFGHAAGDQALIETVSILRSCLRSDDFLARYAGDEFVGVFPASTQEELDGVISRVRARFAEAALKERRYKLSLSIGASLFDPSLDENPDKFIERIDTLMYKEKQERGGTRHRR